MAPHKIPPLPRRVTIKLGPFNYEASVRLASQKALDEVCAEMGGNGGDPGVWDDGNRTVYIDRKLGPEARWRVMFHELEHVFSDAKLKLTWEKLGRM